MANKEKHRCFQPPRNTNIKIWRYMDFTKYVSFLDSKSLFFSRSDLFDDPYEGSTSPLNIISEQELLQSEGIPFEEFIARSSEYAEWIRQWVFVNCWHMNEHESAAMWKLYAQTNEAVAIQSTYRRFCECVPDNVYVGVVQYIDYENELLPEGNIFWPFVHKRKSFEHERELRGVIYEFPGHDNLLKRKPNPDDGKLVHINPEELVTCVHISPSAPKWFLELVKAVTKQYGFSFEVNQSLLSTKPVF